ncbi:MAG: hypothetical protein U0840_04420 [Gemmataceae bacterium]
MSKLHQRILFSSLAWILLTGLLRGDNPDTLEEAKKRLQIEAQRVEREFADERAAAYRLVRSDLPRVLEATEKLHGVLALVRNDTALDAKRREVLIITLKADLDRVQQIATERRRVNLRREESVARLAVQDSRRTEDTQRGDPGRSVSDEARALIESRSRSVTEARLDRSRNLDRYARVARAVEEAAVPESQNMRFPKDWAELSKKRSSGTKLTALEKSIMKALASPIAAEFDKNTLEEVVAYLRKVTGVEIILDKRALEEVSVTYESPVTLKLRASTRTVLKRILSDLNLTYVIKDEAIQITSRERANQMTTTRTYYIGDLATVVDITLPPELTQLIMVENVNRIIANITQNVDSQSWKVNNPDAAGAIVFDPVTMTLVVKQTAEIHFMLSGSR